MMACLGECWDLAGPPPDSILFMPPPPMPAFLQQSPDLLAINNSSGGAHHTSGVVSCVSPQLCDALLAGVNQVLSNGGVGGGGSGMGGDFMELPRKDMENWSSSIDDTWLLVLLASFIGVLILGALLAMFLLKCREMNLFGGSDCSMHNGRPMKIAHHHHEQGRDCGALNGNGKLVHPSETVLYHGAAAHHTNGNNLHTHHSDNRMVWAALTPHGTQHFISENYPHDLVVDYNAVMDGGGDDHYETVDHLGGAANGHVNGSINNYAPPYYHRKEGTTTTLLALRSEKSFDNTGFVDYEYEEPSPLIDTYQLSDRQQQQQYHQYATLGLARASADNTDMRCASLRRHNNGNYSSHHHSNGGMVLPHGGFMRPRVSSPTRIEHPNLPPLNLYPHNTLKKQLNAANNASMAANSALGSSSYRNGGDTLPKYAC